MLEECARNFGPTPRKFSWWARWTYMSVPKPGWLKNSGDQLEILFDHLHNLWRDGKLVWGCVIQANALMFQPGRHSCPGELVYSLEHDVQDDLNGLIEVARHIGSLKGTRPQEPHLARIAEYLTDEMIRVFGVKVPTLISPSRRYRISTTFFERPHLPGRQLLGAVMPIVVNPIEPHVAMPLPERYWPDSLVCRWMNGHLPDY